VLASRLGQPASASNNNPNAQHKRRPSEKKDWSFMKPPQPSRKTPIQETPSRHLAQKLT
jgi:hypothetical protein